MKPSGISSIETSENPTIKLVPSHSEGIFITETDDGNVAVKEIHICDADPAVIDQIRSGDLSELNTVVAPMADRPWSFVVSNMCYIVGTDSLGEESPTPTTQVFEEFIPFVSE
jgi:hypothetical protein